MPLTAHALRARQAPAALRKAIGQQLIEQALGRKQQEAAQLRSGGGAGGGGTNDDGSGGGARAGEPADLASFGRLLDSARAGLLPVAFVCAQVGAGARGTTSRDVLPPPGPATRLACQNSAEPAPALIAGPERRNPSGVQPCLHEGRTARGLHAGGAHSSTLPRLHYPLLPRTCHTQGL